MFNIQIRLAADAGAFDVDVIDAFEGADDFLGAVREEGVAVVEGDDLDGHAGFDADAVELRPHLCGYTKSWHK